MKLNQMQLGLAVGAVVIVVAGFFAGRTLRPDPTPGYEFSRSADVYEATAPEPGLSKGGFSGFGKTSGLPGYTLLSGEVTSISPSEVVIEAADGTRSTIRLNNPDDVRRIENASRQELRSGVTVVVRHADGNSEAEAVLILETP